MWDLDPIQYSEADRRAVDPPVEVQVATWSPAGTLDWWMKERREWTGRVRGDKPASGNFTAGVASSRGSGGSSTTAGTTATAQVEHRANRPGPRHRARQEGPSTFRVVRGRQARNGTRGEQGVPRSRWASRGRSHGGGRSIPDLAV